MHACMHVCMYGQVMLYFLTILFIKCSHDYTNIIFIYLCGTLGGYIKCQTPKPKYNQTKSNQLCHFPKTFKSKQLKILYGMKISYNLHVSLIK